MAITKLQNRSHRLPWEMAQGALVAVFSGFLFLGGCQSIGSTSPGPDITDGPGDGSDFKPQAVIDVVHVQPFRLEQPFQFDWRRDKPEVRSGLLVVFKVDPKLVTPRNALEPVLYSGNQTVQRLNHGHESGFVIGIIPEQIDLAKQPSWFGTPALPERIDAEMIAQERTRAERLGILALPSAAIRSRTRDPVVAPNLTTLLRDQAADLVLQFSPQERRLADSWRLPATGQ